MSKQNLKTFFNKGDRPTEGQFAQLIDESVNKIDDKVSIIDAGNASVDEGFTTPKAVKSAIDLFTVKKVNNVSPDPVTGNVTLVNVTGITGNILKSQVTGLQADLDAKQNLLVSGTNIKTINNISILGSGNITVPETIIAAPNAPFILSKLTGLQNAFPESCGSFTLLAKKTYFFKGKYLLTKDPNVSHGNSIGWAIGPGLTISSMEYVVHGLVGTVNVGTSAIYHVYISGTGAKAVNSANSLPMAAIEFEGIIRTGPIGGTLTPRVSYTVAATADNINTMKVGSYIEFREIGTDTFEKNWD